MREDGAVGATWGTHRHRWEVSTANPSVRRRGLRQALLIAALAVTTACGSGPPPAPPLAPPTDAAPSGSVARDLPGPSAPHAIATPADVPSGSLRLPDGTAIPLLLRGGAPGATTLRPATHKEQVEGAARITGDKDVSAVRVGYGQVLLAWVGTVCERGYAIEVSPGPRLQITPLPRPGCDLGRTPFAAVLEGIPWDGPPVVVLLRPRLLPG